MQKIAVGGGLPDGVVDLDAPVARTCATWPRPRSCDMGDLVVCMLERDRAMPRCWRTAARPGARCMLLGDGDVAGVIATALPDGGVDIYMGSGGAPEGVLAAAALRCIGGQMQGRLLFEDEAQVERARADGRERPQAQIQVDEMARATSCSPPPASPPGRC